MTKTQGSKGRKSTLFSTMCKFTFSNSQPQANNQAGQVRGWRAGVVLSVRSTRAEAVLGQIQPALGDSEWKLWEDKGRRPWKKPSTSPSHFFQMWLHCLEEFSSCGLGEACVWELDSQRHLKELWTTASNICPPRRPPPSSFFPLFFAASNCKHMRSVSRSCCQADSAHSELSTQARTGP